MEIKKETILIVDDNEVNILILRRPLKKEGFDIISSTHGEEAISLASEYLPDLILLDVMMPEIDGFTICKRLKENLKTKNIPVIFQTAKLEDTGKTTGMSVGGADYITKPYNIKEVLSSIRAHLIKNKSEKGTPV